MKSEILEIGIPCGNNSDFFADFLLRNICKTKSDAIKHRMILGINNYESFDLGVLQKFQGTFEIEYFFIKTDTLPGSVGHALTLSAILERMNSKVGVFLDVDVAFLTKNWDKTFIDEIKNDTIVFGTSYENPNKYRNFPSLTACSFDIEKIKNLNIDFKPLMDPPDSKYVVQTQLESKAWNKRIGDIVVLDCGYQLPLKVLESGYFGKAIPYQARGILGIGQEFHYLGNPFLTHMKGSSTCDENNSKSKRWTAAIENHISKL